MASLSEMEKLLQGPIQMAPNTYLHFYNGGKLRAEFMGEPEPQDDYRSEEWIFSTNRAITPSRDNPPDKGISRVQLPDGGTVLLSDLLRWFDEDILGEEHLKRSGRDLGILVKIFDVGEGAHIPVHWHPTPDFAQQYLNSPNGKNEAWIVVGTRENARAWIGWKEDIKQADFRQWANAQDVETMRSHMHEVRPEVGHVLVLQAPLVHTIEGICVLEPQEPTDWNILAEWGGIFPFEKEDGLCGLTWEQALDAADFSALGREDLQANILRPPAIAFEDGLRQLQKLTPPEFDPYFSVYRIQVKAGGIFTASKKEAPGPFQCLTCTQGEGVLRCEVGDVELRRGKSYLLPNSMQGESYQLVNKGSEVLEIVVCFPPKL